MTAYTITAATSSVGDVTQFSKTKATASSLTIDSGAFLVSNLENGAELKGLGNWTVNVDGTLYGLLSGLHIVDIAGDDASKAIVSVSSGGNIGSASSPAVYIERPATVTNNGSIVSGSAAVVVVGSVASTIDNHGTMAGASDLSGFQLAILGGGNGHLTVNNAGTILGGFFKSAGSTTINNTGKITFDSTFGSNNLVIILGSGADTVTNSNLINGTVSLGDGANVLTNSGRITKTGTFENSVVGLADADLVANTKSGVLTAMVKLGAGANKLDNAGRIGFDSATFESYQGLGGADTVVNTGVLSGSVNMGAGKNLLTNSGSIGGSTSYLGDIGADTVKNLAKGSMSGITILGEGAGIVNNAGLMHSITGGSVADKVTNSGKILGAVDLFGGNDILTNTGTITGKINLGDGDDTLNGGTGSEKFTDSFGTDTLNFGGGNDVFYAYGGESDGTDKVFAGAGTDRYSAADMSVGLRINIDTVSHTNVGHGIPVLATAAGTAIDMNEFKADIISGFENVTGSAFDDVIFGNAAANVINGGTGNDEINGYGGNDVLNGGGAIGGDFLTGGGGRDKLFGTAGSLDNFDYTALSDSGTTAATRDTIIGFEDGVDGIHFRGGLAGKFTAPLLINAAFTGAGHELRVMTVAAGYIVEGDLNGDKVADMSIFVQNATHTISWSLGADFLT